MDPIELLDRIRVMWINGYNVVQIASDIRKGNKFVINRLVELGLDRHRSVRRYGHGSCTVCIGDFQKTSTRHELCPTCIPNRTALVFWQRYRLTRPQHVALYEAQGGCCKLCLKPIVLEFDPNQRFSVVDHDHETSRVRGLLCGNCNWAVGVIETRSKDTAWMKRVTEYLCDEPH